MRRYRDGGTRLLWLTAVLFLSLSVLPARAQAVPQYSPHGAVLHLDPDAVRQQMASSRDTLVDVNNETTIIKYLHTLAGTRTTEDQDQIISEMTDYAIGRGLRPSPDIAEAFLSMGLDAKTRGKWAEYRRMARYAESFDPDLPSIHLALAETARHHDGVFSGEYIFETLAAFFTSFRNIETRWIALSNLLIWLRITLFILLGVISLLLLLKYQALLRHDVREWLGGGDSKWIEVAGWVAVFLPSLLLLSGYWWIIYWAGIFLLYARWSERVVTIVVVLLFATVSALTFFCLQRLYLDQAPPNVSNVRCYANRIDAGLDAYLANHTSPKDPLERTYSFLLAGRYMLHGSYLKAENLYRRTSQGEPGRRQGRQQPRLHLFLRESLPGGHPAVYPRHRSQIGHVRCVSQPGHGEEQGLQFHRGPGGPGEGTKAGLPPLRHLQAQSIGRMEPLPLLAEPRQDSRHGDPDRTAETSFPQERDLARLVLGVLDFRACVFSLGPDFHGGLSLPWPL